MSTTTPVSKAPQRIAGARRKSNTIERGTSLTAAFQMMRKLIVLGQLSPGSWIVETDLAKRLGLSRTPIRGALQWLQREGYVVENRENTKARMLVAPLTKEDARELYTIVGHFEALAGSLTATYPPDRREKLAADLAALNNQLNEIATQQPVDPRRVFDLDEAFHNRLMTESAGPRLRALYHSVRPQVERYWRLYASTIINELHRSVTEHNEIVSAIRKGDPEAIERGIQRNWLNGLERISRLIELFGERGSW
jgi:DNA-binding GntR family transcriptional regulator